MAAQATVKVAREKLIELLRGAKQTQLDAHDERVRENERETEKALKDLTAAAAKDLSQRKNLDALSDALNLYLRHKRRDDAWAKRDRKRLIEEYDAAIRLVEISSDETLRVTSSSEFGRLLGL